MLLAVVVSVLGASVEVAVDAPCVEAAFSGRLANAGVVLPPDSTLSLRRANGDVLEVTLKPRGAAPMRREVPAAARDCAGVERVVMALVKAWLASPVMVARAGRDGGALVDGGVPRVDGPRLDAAAASGSVDAGGSPSEAGSSVAARGVVIAGVDGGLSTAVRGDVAGAAAATRSGVDGGPVTPSRGDVAGAATGVRSGVDGTTGTPSRADAGGPAAARVPGAVDGVPATPARGADGRLVTPSPADVDDASTTPGRESDGGRVTPARADAGGAARLVAADERLASVSQAMVDGGTLTSPREDDVSPATSPARVADGGTDAARVAADAVAPRWSFGAGLLGGIASGTTTDIVPQGLLSVDVTRGWFGAALDVGLSGNVSRQVAPGAVTSSWQWLSLSARAVWEPLRRVSLDAQLGGRAHRIVALATGYAETKPEQQLLSLGAVGSVGASVRIVGPVGLTVRATGVVKPPERFTIDNLGAVLDLGMLEGGVHAGVVVRW